MNTNTTVDLIRRLFGYLRLQYGVFIVAALFAFTKALLALGLVAISRWLLNSYGDLEEIISLKNILLLTLMLVVFLIVIYYRVYLPVYLSSGIIREMRHELYRHLQRLSADFYSRHKTGEIISRITNDITMAQLLFSTVVINSIFDITTLAVALVYVMFTYPFMVYLPVIVVSILYGVLMRVFLPRIRVYSQDVQYRLGDITGEVTERVMGMRVLQSFTHEDYAGQVVDEKLDLHYSASLKLAKSQSAFSALAQFLPEVARLAVIIIGVIAVARAELAVGDIAGMILVLGHVFFPLKRSATTTAEIGTSIGALDRVFEFFDAQPTVKDSDNPVDLTEPQGNIKFLDVSFNYENSGPDTPVLKNVSFSVKAGSQVALVGPSGAGKTTIVDMLSRFYDPQEGTIYIDDIDIRDIAIPSLRKCIGVVMQDTYLFSGTIADNLTIGNPEASETDIIAALKHANAWEFVAQMPNGVHSPISESGASLSGGQKQRLALARVFLKDPKILILDEATSALDADSESKIMAALNQLKQNRTTIMISHRLTRLDEFDQIMVVERGRIVEVGQLEQLLELDGTLANLYRKQQATEAHV